MVYCKKGEKSVWLIRSNNILMVQNLAHPKLKDSPQAEKLYVFQVFGQGVIEKRTVVSKCMQHFRTSKGQSLLFQPNSSLSLVDSLMLFQFQKNTAVLKNKFQSQKFKKEPQKKNVRISLQNGLLLCKSSFFHIWHLLLHTL